MSMQTIIRDSAPPAQSHYPGVLDGADPDDVIEVVPETFCLACQAPVAPSRAFSVLIQVCSDLRGL